MSGKVLWRVEILAKYSKLTWQNSDPRTSRCLALKWPSVVVVVLSKTWVGCPCRTYVQEFANTLTLFFLSNLSVVWREAVAGFWWIGGSWNCTWLGWLRNSDRSAKMNQKLQRTAYLPKHYKYDEFLGTTSYPERPCSQKSPEKCTTTRTVVDKWRNWQLENWQFSPLFDAWPQNGSDLGTLSAVSTQLQQDF